MTMKNAVFWDDTPCDSCKNRCFGGMVCLHHQGDKNRRRYEPSKRRFLKESLRNITEDGMLVLEPASSRAEIAESSIATGNGSGDRWIGFRVPVESVIISFTCGPYWLPHTSQWLTAELVEQRSHLT
jgi:hypothetical protein